MSAVRLLGNVRGWQWYREYQQKSTPFQDIDICGPLTTVSTTQVCEPEILQLYDISEHASQLFLFSTIVALQALAYNFQRRSILIIDAYSTAVYVTYEETMEVRER